MKTKSDTIQLSSNVFFICLAFSFTLVKSASASEFVGLNQASGVDKGIILNVQQSSVRLRIANGSVCTGTWVSEDGVLLTALHCLESCLSYPDDNAIKPIETESVDFNDPGSAFPVPVLINRINKKRALERVCTVESDQFGVSSNLGARLLFTPARGWIDSATSQFLRKNENAFFQNLRTGKISGIGDELDLVLIKIMPITIGSPISLPDYFTWPAKCAKINFEKIHPDQNIFSISYPAFNRLDKNSLYVPKFTFGTILDKENQDKNLKVFLENNFVGNNFIISTLDAEGGSSGSGIFDIQGFLRGLTFMTFTPSTHYLSGRTVSIPISNFVDEIPKEIKKILCQ